MEDEGVQQTRWRECLLDFVRFVGLLSLGLGFFTTIAVSEVVPLWCGYAGLIPVLIGWRYRSKFQASFIAMLSSPPRSHVKEAIQDRSKRDGSGKRGSGLN